MTYANETWKQLELTYKPFRQALDAFLTGTQQQRIGAIRENYQVNRPLVILLLLEFVSVEDLEELLPFLLSHAQSIHGYLWAFRSIILRIPREWLTDHIEKAAEPFLQGANDEAFRRLLELYFEIAPSLVRRLAERALASSDAETREAGADFLEKLAG